MPATVNNSNDRELLIRMDERLMLLLDRMAKVEQSLRAHQDISLENKIKIDKICNDLYGNKNTEGLIQKVDRHDKLLAKAVIVFTIIAVCIEYLAKIFL